MPGLRFSLLGILGTVLVLALVLAVLISDAAWVGGLAFTAFFAVLALASVGALVGLDNYWSNEGYWWGWWDRGPYRPSLPEFAAHVHTDRPIYRPGHTVHYKATLRRLAGEGYRLIEPGLPITATVQDAQGNTLATSQPTLDGYGSFAGTIALGEDVGLGQWNLQVDVAGRQSFWAYFQVQAYVKPDFEVTVAPAQPFYVRGDQAELAVAARYYFGQPAAGAAATVRLYRGYYSPGNQATLEAKGTLDPDGTWTAFVPLAASGASIDASSRYLQYRVELSTTDASNTPALLDITFEFTGGGLLDELFSMFGDFGDFGDFGV